MRAIDRVLWPIVNRRSGYSLLLSLILSVLGVQLAWPDMMRSTCTWALLDSALVVIAIQIVDSRVRYVVWRNSTPARRR